MIIRGRRRRYSYVYAINAFKYEIQVLIFHIFSRLSSILQQFKCKYLNLRLNMSITVTLISCLSVHPMMETCVRATYRDFLEERPSLNPSHLVLSPKVSPWKNTMSSMPLCCSRPSVGVVFHMVVLHIYTRTHFFHLQLSSSARSPSAGETSEALKAHLGSVKA